MEQRVQALLKPENLTPPPKKPTNLAAVASKAVVPAADPAVALAADPAVAPAADPAVAPAADPAVAPAADPAINPDTENHFDALLRAAYLVDPVPNEVLTLLRTGVQRCKVFSLAECSEEHGRLHFRGRLYIPGHDDLRLHVLRQAHDAPAAGHPGKAKTLELLTREYFWPGMRKDVDRYVRNCHPCQRAKASRQPPFGTLKPNAVPDAPWQDLSMDFVVGLPESRGFNAIWVVVDRLTKLCHMVPCKSTCSSEDLAELFLHNVWKHHGLPNTIISDRGPQFASRFWKALCKCLTIELQLSTGFHP